MSRTHLSKTAPVRIPNTSYSIRAKQRAAVSKQRLNAKLVHRRQMWGSAGFIREVQSIVQHTAQLKRELASLKPELSSTQLKERTRDDPQACQEELLIAKRELAQLQALLAEYQHILQTTVLSV